MVLKRFDRNYPITVIYPPFLRADPQLQFVPNIAQRWQ